MEWRDLVIDGYGRIFDALKENLKGLAQKDLDWQPKPDCNSIGWTAWHLTRGQDAEIAGLLGEEQLWTTEGWHKKFHRPADPYDTGYGHTDKDVAAFKSPDVKTLLAYHKAVMERTQGYLKSLTTKELTRVLDEDYTPKPTVAVRIVSVMADELGHAGEIDYLHGLLKGKGWLGY